MNLHGISKSSFVNGPGNRFVIWTQGCSKGCKNVRIVLILPLGISSQIYY